MRNLSLKDLPVVFIACQVFEGLFEKYLPEDIASKIVYLDYGMHRLPNKISRSLQEVIDGLDEPSLVVLGFGLCGNGLSGTKAGKHALLIPCVDDCIAVLLGSHQAYLREFEAVPGTYYLSKGWLEAGSHPLKEYQEYIDIYGQEKAQWIMDQQYQNYKRVLFVVQSQEDLDAYGKKAREVAQYCKRWDMVYEEMQGSDRYIKNLVDVALDPDKINEEFVLILPGGEICLEQFLR